MAEQSRRHKRIATRLLEAALAQPEQRDERDTAGHRRVRPPRPTLLLAFDQRREQRDEAGSEQDQSQPVSSGIGVLDTSGEQHRRGGDGKNPDRDVHPEDQPPARFCTEGRNDQPAVEKPMVAPRIANARPRCRRANISWISAVMVVKKMPPANPWSARAAIN